MTKGVWLCQRMGLKKYGVPASRPGGAGCNRWNVYISSGNKGGGVADVRCKTCNKRVKFRLSVPGEENRGRPRVVLFLRRPEHMPPAALLQEVRTRNIYNATGEEIQTLEGFVKASELIE
jgi:hypothetical protein